MTPPARILVIRFSSIGDIVLTTPVLRALKTQLHGGAEVHFLTKRRFAELMEGNPYVDRIHAIENTVQEVIPELEKIHFDYIIDLHRNIRSRIVKRRLKALYFAFDKCNAAKWLWVNFGTLRRPIPHVVERYMDTLRAFSVQDDHQGLDYFIPDGKGIKDDLLPDAHRNGFVALALGGAHIGKRMNAAQLEVLCRSVPHPVVLLGGAEDAETGAALENSGAGKILNLAGKLTIHESADVVRRSRLVISGDTGLMHIAAAFRKRIISVWGCTVPGLGMAPWRPDPDSVIIEPRGREKRPCSKLGNRCKYGANNRCIEHIDLNEVVTEAERLWDLELHGLSTVQRTDKTRP